MISRDTKAKENNQAKHIFSSSLSKKIIIEKKTKENKNKPNTNLIPNKYKPIPLYNEIESFFEKKVNEIEKRAIYVSKSKEMLAFNPNSGRSLLKTKPFTERSNNKYTENRNHLNSVNSTNFQSIKVVRIYNLMKE